MTLSHDPSPYLLELRDLRVSFQTPHGPADALNGVSLGVRKGEILCIVGESGCGKSLTSLAVMGLIRSPGRVTGGEILFEGRNLRLLRPEEMRALRGNRLSMIFQEPMTSLNPVLRVGDQIAESLVAHRGLGRAAAQAEAAAMLRRVGIADPERRAREYPHQFSGGMRQRVMIAMALACKPQLLIADEPTTALDVTIQTQVLDLILNLKDALGMAVILITHDLGVVAEIADRVAVMYAGRVVETARATDLFDNPRHPYTRQLLAAMPARAGRGERLAEIVGVVPPLWEPPPGCGFCPRRTGPGACQRGLPPMVEAAPGHFVRCWQADAGVAA